MKMDCKRFGKHLHAYVDGAVPPAFHAALETHAASCPACRREVEALAQLGTVLRAAAAAVLVFGLALGAVMGWDANRNGRSPSSVATQPDALAAYNLDYLAEAPAGSLAQVVLALNQ